MTSFKILSLIYQDPSKLEHLQQIFLKNISFFNSSSLELSELPSFEKMKEFLTSKTQKTHKFAQKYFQSNSNKVICLFSIIGILHGKSFAAFVNNFLIIMVTLK